MEGKIGQIGFVITKTNWLSRAISWFLGSPYSHAFLIINSTETIETDTKEVHIDSLIDHMTNPNKSCEIYETHNLSQKDKETILANAKSQLGTRYSYKKFLYLALYLLLKKIGIRISIRIKGTVCDDVPAIAYKDTDFNEIKETQKDLEELRQYIKKSGEWICVFKH